MRRRSLIPTYIALSALALAFLLPFYVLVRNAFSTQRWITSPDWHWLGNVWGFDNFASLLSNDNVPILLGLWNSAVVSVLQTVLTVVIAMMAGYGLARYSGRMATVILGLTVFTLMVPTTVTFVPSFVMASSLGWVSTFRGLIVPTLFSAFAVFLFRQHFLGFPKELEEAARIDGATPWGAFWRIVVPNSMGMVGAVGTITFIGAWNAFLWPMLIAQDPQMRTVQVMLSSYMTSQGVRYPELFTGALIAVVPVLFVFLFLQRWLVQGVEQSGLD
jgi:multiple sugar transport system permease protein